MVVQRDSFIEAGKRVILQEAQALASMAGRIDGAFSLACRHLLECQSKVIVLGMGKSGHVGRKIAATFASTGTPAFFVHPGEANHGDFGMISAQDVVILISNSGNTPEILSLLTPLKHLKVPIIAMTGRLQSPLAHAATVVLDVGVDAEACALGLAPTTSTTATLAMGDALAVALVEARGFNSMDYARSHPGGSLGRRLLLRVQDIMRSGDALPWVKSGTTIGEAILEVTNKRLGMTAVVDAKNTVLGVFTDGDLRRAFARQLHLDTPVDAAMTAPCKTVSPELKAYDALAQIEKMKINGFLVVDQNNTLLGAFNIHDLFAAGLGT